MFYTELPSKYTRLNNIIFFATGLHSRTLAQYQPTIRGTKASTALQATVLTPGEYWKDHKFQSIAWVWYNFVRIVWIYGGSELLGYPFGQQMR